MTEAEEADVIGLIEEATGKLDALHTRLDGEKFWRERQQGQYRLLRNLLIGAIAVVVVFGIALGAGIGILINIGSSNRCTQNFIVDIVNPGSELGTRVRSGQPIANPCR